MSIGSQTVKHRKKLGISQEELSQRSDISLRTIQRLEKDQVKPRGFTLNRLAQVLQVSLEDLQEGSGDTNERLSFQKLRMLNTLGLLSVFLPIVHLVVQGYYWKTKLEGQQNQIVGSKIISFQIWWSILVILTLVLFQVVTFAITGQRTVGHFPWRSLLYLALLVINILCIFRYSITLEKRGSDLQIPFPTLF